MYNISTIASDKQRQEHVNLATIPLAPIYVRKWFGGDEHMPHINVKTPQFFPKQNQTTIQIQRKFEGS
jgi:hypothetical protein